MFRLDLVDKLLLLRLSEQCRLSYQALAQHVGLTVSGVKNRVNKLVESGIINRFLVNLNVPRYGYVNLFYAVSTDGGEDKERFIQGLAATRSIFNIGRLVDGSYAGGALVSTAEEVLKLDRELRRMENVTQVELRQIAFVNPSHPKTTILTDKRAIQSRALTFSKFQKQVLRCLIDDVRMPITKIAQQAKLTPRRVRRILNELETGGNVEFTISLCPGAGEDFDCGIRTQFDPSKGKAVGLVDWFQEKYPLEHWWSFIFEDEPVCIHKIVVSDLRIVEGISDEARTLPLVDSVHTFIYHTTRNFPTLSEVRLKQMLEIPDK